MAEELAPPPRGVWRALARFPIWLYRARLGWLLGHRFLLLTHIGRRSGLPRRTVLEVVRRDKATGTYYIVSGHGEQSQWCRNISKTPEVEVQVGRRRWPALAQRLFPQEAEREFAQYARRYPLAWRLASRFLHYPAGESPTDFGPVAQVVPVFALRPRA